DGRGYRRGDDSLPGWLVFSFRLSTGGGRLSQHVCCTQFDYLSHEGRVVALSLFLAALDAAPLPLRSINGHRMEMAFAGSAHQYSHFGDRSWYHSGSGWLARDAYDRLSHQRIRPDPDREVDRGRLRCGQCVSHRRDSVFD